jgi:hypothetical protein
MPIRGPRWPTGGPARTPEPGRHWPLAGGHPGPLAAPARLGRPRHPKPGKTRTHTRCGCCAQPEGRAGRLTGQLGPRATRTGTCGRGTRTEHTPRPPLPRVTCRCVSRVGNSNEQRDVGQRTIGGAEAGVTAWLPAGAEWTVSRTDETLGYPQGTLVLTYGLISTLSTTR